MKHALSTCLFIFAPATPSFRVIAYSSLHRDGFKFMHSLNAKHRRILAAFSAEGFEVTLLILPEGPGWGEAIKMPPGGMTGALGSEFVRRFHKVGSKGAGELCGVHLIYCKH